MDAEHPELVDVPQPMCGELTENPTVYIYKYYCGGLLVSTIGIVGILGDVCSILVLSRPKLQDCFHQLLIALAAFDILYILCGGINYTVRAFEFKSDIYTIAFPHFIYPFANIGLCGTIFMTVAISIERFLGICYPLHLPPHNRKSWFYILPVLVLAILVNIPKFLESEVTWYYEGNAIENLKVQVGNVTVLDIPQWVPTYHVTPLRRNSEYMKYYIVYFRMFLTAIIPLILMVFLNLRIIIDIGTIKVKSFGSSSRWRSELNLFIILLCIVITFCCCHTPRVIIDMWEFSNLNNIIMCIDLKKTNPNENFLPPTWIRCLTHVSHTMSILNSSVNFLIYSFVGHTFRREFFLLIGCEKSCRFFPKTSNSRRKQEHGVSHQKPNEPFTDIIEEEEKERMLEV